MCPVIDAGVLLVSGLDYTVRIFLCPQVTVVEIDDAVCIKARLVC